MVASEVISEGRTMQTAEKHVESTDRTPPHAPLAFRVGVVGHRPDRLKKDKLEELAVTIRMILSTVKEESLAVQRDCAALYDGAGLVLRAISPLAEGTDRVFAEQALHFCFALCCVLPFSQAEFEKDFAPGKALEEQSLRRFQHLLDQATTRFELDGNRVEESEAYSAGGRVVLNQSDLLVVVWDGQRLHKRGGTEETFDEARSRGLSVAWIDAHEPQRWQLLDAATPLPRVPGDERVVPDGSGSGDSLRRWVREALELPRPRDDETTKDKTSGHENHIHPRRALELFYAEHRPRWSLAVFWKILQQVVADTRWPKVTTKVEDFEEAVTPKWPKDRSTPVARLVDYLRPFYAWPDKLAVLYADRYRSTFLLAFLLAAAAVGLALLPVAVELLPHHPAEIACIGLEFVAIVAILALVLVGRRRRWHERWIDYRYTAELVRHLRLVAPLGGRRPFPQIPAHRATYGQPGATWMAWYVRAVERALGLPCAVVDKAYLDGYMAHLADVVSEQIDFHETAARRYHDMEKRLHGCGIGLLALTLLACGLHLVLSVWHGSFRPTWLPPQVLTFFCGFFPALGAALAGIINQGEFRSLTNRSDAMREQLDRLLNQTTTLRQQIDSTPDLTTRQFSAQAVDLASATAGLLVSEILDWRVVLLDQPLRPPS
jgi:hypothetical protein